MHLQNPIVFYNPQHIITSLVDPFAEFISKISC